MLTRLMKIDLISWRCEFTVWAVTYGHLCPGFFERKGVSCGVCYAMLCFMVDLARWDNLNVELIGRADERTMISSLDFVRFQDD